MTETPTANELYERGYRAWKKSGENADRYTLVTPDPEELTLRFEDRFDETSGIDLSVLVLRQTEGPKDALDFVLYTRLLEELVELTRGTTYSFRGIAITE